METFAGIVGWYRRKKELWLCLSFSRCVIVDILDNDGEVGSIKLNAEELDSFIDELQKFRKELS